MIIEWGRENWKRTSISWNLPSVKKKDCSIQPVKIINRHKEIKNACCVGGTNKKCPAWYLFVITVCIRTDPVTHAQRELGQKACEEKSFAKKKFKGNPGTKRIKLWGEKGIQRASAKKLIKEEPLHDFKTIKTGTTLQNRSQKVVVRVVFRVMVDSWTVIWYFIFRGFVSICRTLYFQQGNFFVFILFSVSKIKFRSIITNDVDVCVCWFVFILSLVYIYEREHMFNVALNIPCCIPPAPCLFGWVGQSILEAIGFEVPPSQLIPSRKKHKLICFPLNYPKRYPKTIISGMVGDSKWFLEARKKTDIVDLHIEEDVCCPPAFSLCN